MAVALRITVMGEEIVARALSRFGEGITDFTPVWEQIQQNFAVIEEQQFDSLGSRGGLPWPALSPAYAVWKEKYFPGRRIMQLTYLLWGELAVGTGLMVEVAPKTLRLTVTAPYAYYHQHGLGNNPIRKVIQLTEADKMNWMKYVQNYVYDKAKEAHLL